MVYISHVIDYIAIVILLLFICYFYLNFIVSIGSGICSSISMLVALSV